MKKAILSLVLVLCLMAASVFSVSAATPVDLMATSDDGYTIVAGDGTVEITDGKMVFTNNTDGDFRITIDTKTVFDLETLHTLRMNFDAEMPFKMAYHIVSEDGTSAWLNTSTNFVGVFEVDTTADRAAAGEYALDLKLTDEITTITDMTQVHYEQFIILMTGKGTFTLDTVKMTDGSEEETTDEETEETTTTKATTTTKKEASKDDAEESAKTGDTTNAVLFATVAVAAAGVVTLSVMSKKSKAN